jgi:hypothetical protein
METIEHRIKLQSGSFVLVRSYATDAVICFEYHYFETMGDGMSIIYLSMTR